MAYALSPAAVVDAEEKAVQELMRKHKLEGSVAGWREAYDLEFGSVAGLRLIELTDEEAKEVRAGTLVPRLRMLLYSKRCGRKKGRLVLQGFSEPFAWDNNESNYSPVAQLSSVRMLLAKAGVDDVISKRDISVAFLQSDEYTADEPARYCSYRQYRGGPVKYYRLRGPLYGQRSAPRRWYQTFASWLKDDLGMEAGLNEPCVFNSDGLTVLIYVDDCLTRGSAEATAKFHRALEAKFKATQEEYLGVDSSLEFLGFNISKERGSGGVSVYMDQETALKAMLSDFTHAALPPKDSPMPTKALFDSDPAPLSALEQTVYRHHVGCLN